MKIVKINNLPQTYEADTIYLLKSSTAGLVEIYVTNNDATDIRSLGMSQVGGGVDDLIYEQRTSNTVIGAADKGKLIEITSGFSSEQLIASASTLGNGWWCYYKNASGEDISFPGTLMANTVNNVDFASTSPVSIPNAGFDTDTSWTKGTGWSISGGKAVATSTNSHLTVTTAVLTVDTLIKVTLTVTRTAGTLRIIGSTGSDISSTGTHVVYLRASQTQLQFLGISSFSGTIDDISVVSLNGVVSKTTAAIWKDDGKITFSNYSATGLSQAVAVTLTGMETGKLYEVTYQVVAAAGDIRFSFNDVVDGTARNTTGVYTETIVATASFANIHFEMVTAAFTGTVSNITVRKKLGVVDQNDQDGLIVVYPNEMRLLYSTGEAILSKPLQSYKKTMTSSGYFIKPTGYREHDVTLWGSGGNGFNAGIVRSTYGGNNIMRPGSGGACAKARYSNSAVSKLEYLTLNPPGSPYTYNTFLKTKAGNGYNGAWSSSIAIGTPILSDGVNIPGMSGGTYQSETNGTDFPTYGGASGLRIVDSVGIAYPATLSDPSGGWNISTNRATHVPSTKTSLSGTVQCTAGAINSFVLQGGNLGSGETYTLTLSGGVSFTVYIYTSYTTNSDTFVVSFIPTTSTVNFTLTPYSVYSTAAIFDIGTKNMNSWMNQSPLEQKKSIYGGNGGYLEPTQSNTNGQVPGGGGGVYIDHANGVTLGRGARGQLIIEGVI